MESEITSSNILSTAIQEDEGIIALDVSSNVLVDSVTAMPQTAIAPELIISDVTNNDDEEPTKLTLAYERLNEIPRTIVEKFSNYIQYLDISHNKITNLDPIVHFKHLTSLIADDNLINENCILPPMPKLQLIWLNYCKIASLYPWVGKLKESCPNLQYLSLMGNPAAPSYFNGGTFYEYLQYRLFVISQFPSLYHLDDRKVTDDQRDESHRLYKRPLLERITRPSSGGVPSIMNTSITWSSFQNKLASLWSRDKQSNRNLLI
ncbi:leucine-rich melanocyte differentiation-associated protein-like isoform X1 [Leptidea sinapis]|uniref:leucine-rich melanocyte differentiation-associated protein-like isoform X1 n=2 Tax=Leptidea sinapis TaxID=189913 RepID=UPI0021313BBF|nr:leucine-rich melanocyte differentiation-associated protein-like isoform X1 [Leptidea sinapis]